MVILLKILYQKVKAKRFLKKQNLFRRTRTFREVDGYDCTVLSSAEDGSTVTNVRCVQRFAVEEARNARGAGECRVDTLATKAHSTVPPWHVRQVTVCNNHIVLLL